MNFSENTNLLPGGQSASPSKLKELDNKIDDLAQTVTSVADSVADLADEVTTAELNATDANVTNAVIDNATVGTETATEVNADTVNADNLNATDAEITNLTADDVEANSVDADNGYFGSVNAQSFTGQGVNITGDITASAKVQGKTVQATEKVVTLALESTETELKGATTVRGDVYFPETGDKIYGEYLEIEADKVKADIEADTVNATSVTAGTVTATGVASQGLLVTGNSRFMGEVQARNIVPEAGQTLDITTDTLDADSIEADTVRVNSLTTETPTGSSQLVGYDNNGKLIPVNAGLDPANYWELVSGDQTSIQPKDNKKIEATEITTPKLNAEDIDVSDEVIAKSIHSSNALIDGYLNVGLGLTVGNSGETTLKDTEVDGDLTVNGDIIQNGSAYETHAEKVYSKNDLIITRDGAVSGLSTGQYTGIQAKKYDGTNDGQLVFDKDGEARVGDVGDTEPLMTRDELADMTDGSLLKWDGTNKKAVSAQSADIIPSDASTSNKLATTASVNTALANYDTKGNQSVITKTDANLCIPSEQTETINYIAYGSNKNLPTNDASYFIRTQRSTSYIVQFASNVQNALTKTEADYTRKARLSEETWIFSPWEKIATESDLTYTKLTAAGNVGISLSGITFNELVVEITTSNTSFTFHILQDMLTTSAKYFRDGYSYGANTALCTVDARTTSILLSNLYINGTDEKSDATINVYYR